MRQITVENEGKKYLFNSRLYRILNIDKSFHEVIHINDDTSFDVDVDVFDKEGNRLDDVYSYILSLDDLPPDQSDIEGRVTIRNKNKEVVAEFILIEGYIKNAQLRIMLPDDENAKHFICCHSVSLLSPYDCYWFYDFNGKLLEKQAYMIWQGQKPYDLEDKMRAYVPNSNSEKE